MADILFARLMGGAIQRSLLDGISGKEKGLESRAGSEGEIGKLEEIRKENGAK